MAGEKLTPRQRRFADEYLVDLNATAAYKRAGYAAGGNSAEVNAARLLRNAQVAAAVAAGMDARSARTRVRADNALRDLGVVAHSSVWDYVIDDQGNVGLAEGVPPEAIRAVASIRRKVRTRGDVTERETEIRLWPKVEALRLEMQHLNMLKEVLEHTFPQGVPIGPEDVEEGRRRADAYRRERLGLNGHGGPAALPG